MKPRRPELLSPAGGPDAGYAALSYGADAVYLGLKRFSARAEAANFTPGELDALVSYARSLSPRRRVFAAVNTLVLDNEIPELVETLATLREIGVDAIIVQDLGVARIVRRHFPSLELHASTQMAVHNRRGVEALARLGVRRAVVARELTLVEIRSLCAQPDVEIECFIHGAICYSYSGLCLFSSHALGRSANRGRCAYVCGGSFSPAGPRTVAAPGREAGSGFQQTGDRPAAPNRPPSLLPFAMKDLALPHRLDDLAEAGVASFKIEGRKKNALYVAAVTDFYRRLLDKALVGDERARKEEDLRTVFSRPWTELYLGSARQSGAGEPRAVGHRGAPVGRVAAVRGSRREGTWLRFTTSRALEVHDGLQLEIPGLVKPFGFSVEKLRVPGTAAERFEAGPGDVEVALPAGHPSIPVGTPVHCASSQAVKRSFRWPVPREGEHRRRTPLDVEARVAEGRVEVAARLRSAPTVETLQALEETLGPARDAESASAGARGAFERLGNTPFVLGELTVANPASLYVSPSQWNRLRRAAAEALETGLRGAREAEVRYALDALRAENPPAVASPEGRWSVKTERLDLLEAFDPEDWDGVSDAVVALGFDDDLPTRLPALAARVGRERIRLALPPILRSWDEERLFPQVSRLLADGWRRWELANLAHWGHLGLAPGPAPREAGFDLAADWPLYVLNVQAGRTLLDLGVSGLTLSPEDGAENLKALVGTFGALATVVVYQHTPLFVSETCPQANLTGACPGPKGCGYRGQDLVSDFGDRVRVLNRGCRTVVVSRSPFCLSTKLEELTAAGARRFRVDLQYGDLDPASARDLWRAARAGAPLPRTHCANYARGLQ